MSTLDQAFRQELFSFVPPLNLLCVTNPSQQHVSNASPVRFNTVQTSSGSAISFRINNGEIQLLTPGIYMVSYHLCASLHSAATPSELAIFLTANGILVPGSMACMESEADKKQFLSLQTFFEVADNTTLKKPFPVILHLINGSSDSVMVSQACINVIKLSP